jgi:hypothetical protein
MATLMPYFYMYTWGHNTRIFGEKVKFSDLCK